MIFAVKIRSYTTLGFSGLHLSNMLQYFEVDENGYHNLLLNKLFKDIRDEIKGICIC